MTTENDSPQLFPNTHWSTIFAAKEPKDVRGLAALAEFCEAYWHPLYVYARSHGHNPHEAEDLTQEFFHRLIEKDWLNPVDPSKGRLRSFLMVAMKRFMANEWHQQRSKRRGGEHRHFPMDTQFAESSLAAHSQGATPDEAYDRQWALTLLQRSLDRLKTEFAPSKPDAFTALKPCLLQPRGEIDYARLAATLKTSEESARVMIHRMRKRFKEIYRYEVAQTMDKPSEVLAEIHHLANVISKAD